MGAAFCKCCEEESESEGAGWQWHTRYEPVAAPSSDASDEGSAEATRTRSAIEPEPEVSLYRAATVIPTANLRAKRRLSLQPASARSILEHDAMHEDGDGASPLPQTPPIILASRHASLLQPIHLAELRRALPRRLRESAWQKEFCLSYTGASLSKLNNKLAGNDAVVVVARINDGTLVGACVTSAGAGWLRPPTAPGATTSFGTSESFLFSLPATVCSSLVKPKLLGHRGAVRGHHGRLYSTWDNGGAEPRHIIPETHIYRPLDPASTFVLSSSSQICFANDGLWIDADLSQGGSVVSRRFGLSSPICRDRFFDILALEAWRILPP